MASSTTATDLSSASLVRKGGQGSVFRSTYKGRDVAVKVIPHTKSSTIEAELAALRRVNGRHPHIVYALKSAVTSDGDLHLTEELAECDMFDQMQQQEKDHFEENHQFREWMLQCAHFYVKRKSSKADSSSADGSNSSNSGALSDGKSKKRLIAKLCDFGLHMARSQESEAKAVWGFRQDYDLLRQQGYDAHAADVWSFGVMLYVLASGVCPFRSSCIGDGRFRSYVATEQRHVLDDAICAPSSPQWQKDGERIPRWRWPRAFSAAFVDLLRCCLQVRSNERISMADLLKHPWFTRPAWVPPSDTNASVNLAREVEATFPDFIASLLEQESTSSSGQQSVARAGGQQLPPSGRGSSGAPTITTHSASGGTSSSSGFRSSAGMSPAGTPAHRSHLVPGETIGGSDSKEQDISSGAYASGGPQGGSRPSSIRGGDYDHGPAHSLGAMPHGVSSASDGAYSAASAPDAKGSAPRSKLGTVMASASGNGSDRFAYAVNSPESPSKYSGGDDASVAGRAMAMSVASSMSGGHHDPSRRRSVGSGSETTTVLTDPNYVHSSSMHSGMTLNSAVSVPTSTWSKQGSASASASLHSPGNHTSIPVVSGGDRLHTKVRRDVQTEVPQGRHK